MGDDVCVEGVGGATSDVAVVVVADGPAAVAGADLAVRGDAGTHVVEEAAAGLRAGGGVVPCVRGAALEGIAKAAAVGEAGHGACGAIDVRHGVQQVTGGTGGGGAEQAAGAT